VLLIETVVEAEVMTLPLAEASDEGPTFVVSLV